MRWNCARIRLTFQISDPAPLTFDCQPERHRRVRWIWLVRLHFFLDEVIWVTRKHRPVSARGPAPRFPVYSIR